MWSWGRGSGIGVGVQLSQDTLQVLVLFIRACLNNCMVFSFCLFEGEEIEKESCCVAWVGFELLPWIPRVL